jgi:lipopolysaccharide transport system permease protein
MGLALVRDMSNGGFVSIATDALEEVKTVLEPAPQPAEDRLPAPLPLTEFARKPGWWVVELRELWRYRELVYFLAWRDIKVRYKQAALGASWAILQPLLTMIIFTLFFGKLAEIPSAGIPYPVFSFCALVLWTYFSGVVGQAGQSLVSNSNLITKVYFPRVVLPASSAVSSLIDLVVGLGFLVVLMMCYQVHPGWSLFWAPVFLGGLLLFTIGVSLILAAMSVRYRDIKYAIPFAIQLGLFVTPVIYPMAFIPRRFQTLAALNPLSGIVEGFRACLLGGPRIDPRLTVISLAGSVIVFVAGLIYFRKAERVFADII